MASGDLPSTSAINPCTDKPVNNIRAKSSLVSVEVSPQRKLNTIEKTKVNMDKVKIGLINDHDTPRREPLYLEEISLIVISHNRCLFSSKITIGEANLPSLVK